MRTVETNLLSQYSSQEAKSIARRIVMHYTQSSFTQLMLRCKDTLLSERQAKDLIHSIEALQKGIPMQYVIGEVEFGPLTLSVAPGVLIPRPETEELCTLVVEDLQRQPTTLPRNIADIGTGSGCIALYLAYYLRQDRIFAIEKENNAIQIARINIERCSTKDHFSPPVLVQNDLLALSRSPSKEPWEYIDVIVSNPPYIPLREKEFIEDHVLNHEPHSALFVPDSDPLLFYKALLNFALYHSSKKGGSIYCETHHQYACDVANIFRGNPKVQDIEVRKDFSGKERFVIAHLR